MAAVHGAHVGRDEEAPVGVAVDQPFHGHVRVLAQRVVQSHAVVEELLRDRDRLAADGVLKVYMLPQGAIVQFFTISGEKVREYGERNRRVEWDGKNEQGTPVATGTYYCIVRSGSTKLLTEKIIVGAIQAIGAPYRLPWGDKEIDFTPPLARKTYNELFREHTGVEPDNAAAVAQLAKSLGLETANRHPDVIKSDVFEAKVEDALIGPVFVIDYPASICPLTKRKRDNPETAERFELYVHGMEVANAYTELNDPDLQEQLFKTQLEGMPEEESMAKMDHDFIRALRHGMPPAGGLGVGIDRLVMLLTNSPSIRDVILFPLMRPRDDEEKTRSPCRSIPAGDHSTRQVGRARASS